jgi:tetratricopeptide (TPR) repeat protein
MALDQKAWNRAVVEMEQFLRDYPSDKLFVDALYGLGLAYENLNQPEKAVAQYKQIMEQFATKQNSVDAAFRLGSLYFKQERYREAIGAFEFALTRKVTPELKASLLYNLALSYENTGEPVSAAKTYEQFALATKDSAQARDARMAAGLLLKKVELHADAARMFAMVAKSAGSPEVEMQSLSLLGDCYKAAGKDREAIAAYEKLVTFEPPSNDVRLAGLAQLAYIYEQKKELNKAIGIYEKIAISEGRADWTNAAKARIDVLAKMINQLP